MENEKIFELIEQMYSDLKKGHDDLIKEVKNNTEKIEIIENRLINVEKTVTKIENEHSQKLEALLDGYKQNSEQISTIENEVSKHEEVIIRRVK